jgi:[ribosomal protein S5]-alanine N-acetyltransferase
MATPDSARTLRPPMRTLATERLILEPLVAAHADAMFAVLSDPAIYAYENAPPRSADWLRERYARLESRQSGDGTEQWLNWVVHLRGGAPIGYVQATVPASGRLMIAYEFGSAWWGQGYAREATQAMIDELVAQNGARGLAAVLKCANFRSLRLLERLGFAPATPAARALADVEPDECLMQRDVAAA